MIDGYDLDRDLAAVNRALASDMPEAVIFYCGRALEVTSARAITALNLEPGNQVFSNLDTLERLSCISRPALYLGHALRRLSNDARHILRPLTPHDADFAALCLGPWLQWYMEDSFRGPQHRPKHENFGIASPLASGKIAELLEFLGKAQETDDDYSDELLALCDERIARMPALSAMVAEVLISNRHPEQAQGVLNAALAQAPTDIRLTQVLALCRRRAGHPAEAVALLKKLSAKNAEDEETLGITAGALKSSGDIAQALSLYRKGWQVSRSRNLYLGVNAAALQLWLGDKEAIPFAQRIVDIFTARNAQLTKAGINVATRRDYYDQVTEAEARLIAGDDATARALYAAAFDRFGSRQGDIDGSREQAARTLGLLGRESLA